MQYLLLYLVDTFNGAHEVKEPETSGGNVTNCLSHLGTVTALPVMAERQAFSSLCAINLVSGE